MSQESIDLETRPATPTPSKPPRKGLEELQMEELTAKLALLFRDTPADKIHLQNPPLTFKDLNGFIKKWLNGCFPYLDIFTATFSRNIQTSTMYLYQDLQLFTWNSSKRPEFHGDVKCSLGVADVERVDCIRATIIVSMRKFQFLVWKPKYLKAF